MFCLQWFQIKFNNYHVLSYKPEIEYSSLTGCCLPYTKIYITNTKGHFTHKTESPSPLHFKHSHWWKRWSQSKFPSHYGREATRVSECKMDVKVHMDSYMALNRSCYMVNWNVFKKHLLEIILTQNWRCWHSERSQPLIYSISSCARPAWINSYWNGWSHMT